MAEASARELHGDVIEPYSAGVERHGLDPRTVQVMSEAGIDISGNESKTVDQLGMIDFDYVITLCDNARETCPWFPASVALAHRGFDDPPALEGSPEAE